MKNQGDTRKMPFSHSRLWLATVICLGIPLIAFSFYVLIQQKDRTWMWLAIAVSLTSCLKGRVSLHKVGLGGITVSASDCFVLIAIVFLNAWAAILLSAMDAVMVLSRARVARLDRRLFNISQIAVTAFLTARLFEFFRPSSGMTPTVFWLVATVSLVFCGLFYFLTNFTLLSIAVALHSGEKLARIWLANLPLLSPALLLNLIAGLGFSLPLLIPISPQLMWLSAFGALGLVGHVFYTGRLPETAPRLAS